MVREGKFKYRGMSYIPLHSNMDQDDRYKDNTTLVGDYVFIG